MSEQHNGNKEKETCKEESGQEESCKEESRKEESCEEKGSQEKGSCKKENNFQEEKGLAFNAKNISDNNVINVPEKMPPQGHFFFLQSFLEA